MSTEATMTVLVYSDDVDTRNAVKLAVGRRPAADLPRVEWLECATEQAVIAAFDAGAIEVAILDGAQCVRPGASWPARARSCRRSPVVQSGRDVCMRDVP